MSITSAARYDGIYRDTASMRRVSVATIGPDVIRLTYHDEDHRHLDEEIMTTLEAFVERLNEGGFVCINPDRVPGNREGWAPRYGNSTRYHYHMGRESLCGRQTLSEPDWVLYTVDGRLTPYRGLQYGSGVLASAPGDCQRCTEIVHRIYPDPRHG